MLSPPSPDDYLPAVIARNVVRTGVSHPATIFPTAVGLGSALAGFILGWPWLYLVALGGLLGPLWGIIQVFFLPDRLGKKYLRELDRRRDEYKRATRELVRLGLEEPCSSSQASKYACQGLAQYEKVARTLQSIKTVLDMKLNVNELTFHRFLGTAEQAYLSILDNLKDVVARLRSLDSIDTQYISSRVRELKEVENQTRADKDEMNALRERYELWKAQLEDVSILLTRNEEALTAMEHISARVAQWDTDEQFAASDMETVIDDLRDLAEFAHTMTKTL